LYPSSIPDMSFVTFPFNIADADLYNSVKQFFGLIAGNFVSARSLNPVYNTDFFFRKSLLYPLPIKILPSVPHISSSNWKYFLPPPASRKILIPPVLCSHADAESSKPDDRENLLNSPWTVLISPKKKRIISTRWVPSWRSGPPPSSIFDLPR